MCLSWCCEVLEWNHNVVDDNVTTSLLQASLISYSDSNWRIDWGDLRMGKCIGRGGFGEVRGRRGCGGGAW